MRFIEFIVTNEYNQERYSVFINPQYVAMVTPTPGAPLMFTTIFLVTGVEQSVDGRINEVIAKLKTGGY